MEDRLNELEVRLAFQDDLLDASNRLAAATVAPAIPAGALWRAGQRGGVQPARTAAALLNTSIKIIVKQ
jgi:hypothetical protein